MSGVAIARAVMIVNSNLLAVVPSGRILAGTIPLGFVLPAVGLTEVSEVHHKTISMDGSSMLATSRVRAMSHAKTYAVKDQVQELVRKALPNLRATVQGFLVDSILPDAVGPDQENTDAVIYMQTQDFLVKFWVPRT